MGEKYRMSKREENLLLTVESKLSLNIMDAAVNTAPQFLQQAKEAPRKPITRLQAPVIMSGFTVTQDYIAHVWMGLAGSWTP